MTYPSLDAFYAGDRRRRSSRERDVGLWWRERGGATYRAAWVQATGEVYLLKHGRPDCKGGPVRLIGRPTPRARSRSRSTAGATSSAGRSRWSGCSTELQRRIEGAGLA